MVESQVWRTSLCDKMNEWVSKRSRDEEIEMIKLEGWSGSMWVAGDLRRWSRHRSYRDMTGGSTEYSIAPAVYCTECSRIISFQ